MGASCCVVRVTVFFRLVRVTVPSKIDYGEIILLSVLRILSYYFSWGQYIREYMGEVSSGPF